MINEEAFRQFVKQYFPWDIPVEELSAEDIKMLEEAYKRLFLQDTQNTQKEEAQW